MRKISISFLAMFLWASASSAIVDSMDYGSNTMEWRRFDADEPVTAFAENKEMVWYATATSVGVYSMKTNTKNVLANLGSFTSDGVKDMAVDSRSGLWFGMDQGVAYTGDGKQFSNYTTDNGLGDNAVNCILAAGDGTVWAGTEKGAAALLNGSWKNYTTADGLCGIKIRDIASDGHTVWFATNNGIAVFSSGKWTKQDKTNGLSSNDVRAITWDERKKEIWAAVGESDINNYDGKSWNVFMDVQDNIICIMSDTQSRIWVGSSTGIIKYNGFEWIYDTAKMPFAASQCASMCRDDGGNLWFATESGVMRLDNPYPY
jgi:ligand-binding sensor domain-containing protein